MTLRQTPTGPGLGSDFKATTAKVTSSSHKTLHPFGTIAALQMDCGLSTKICLQTNVTISYLDLHLIASVVNKLKLCRSFVARLDLNIFAFIAATSASYAPLSVLILLLRERHSERIIKE